jgi:hypothetical protein
MHAAALAVVTACGPWNWSAAHPTNFYVDDSRPASGRGTSRDDAWVQFSDIDWSVLKPGDTLYIFGGSEGRAYTETLVVGASGERDRPITITAGPVAGRKLPVIDGQNIRAYGIVLAGQNDVIVSRLAIRNHAEAGVTVQGAKTGVIIEELQIYSGDPGGGNARGIDARNNVGERPLLVRGITFSTPRETLAQTDGIWSSDNEGVIFAQNRIIIANSNTEGHSDGIQSYHDHSITICGNWIEQANTATVNNHGLWLSDTHEGGRITVYNNMILAPNLTGDSAVTHWAEPNWSENSTVFFVKNTILGGKRSLNLIGSPWAVVKNNAIVPSAGGSGIYIEAGEPAAANIDYNLIWAHSGSVSFVRGAARSWPYWQAMGYDRHGVNAAPRFANARAQDYRLRGPRRALGSGAQVLQAGTGSASVTRGLRLDPEKRERSMALVSPAIAPADSSPRPSARPIMNLPRECGTVPSTAHS